MFYMSIAGKLFIAAFFCSSNALKYFCVNFKLLCPNNSDTTFTFAPLLSICVANVCLPQWEIIDEASGYRMVS